MGDRAGTLANLVTSDFWRSRRVLVTGHTGFKGAWLCRWLERLGADVAGLALPSFDAAGAYRAMGASVRRTHAVDVRDVDAVTRAVHTEQPTVVFHLAAQALVRRSWREPLLTYATNVLGTANVLEAVRAEDCCEAVVVVTSDKVYAADLTASAYREDSPLGGGDPYSASKAAAEHVVAAWRHCDGSIAVATARAGNVVGGGDTAPDRLLPDIRRAALANVPIRLRHPTFSRPWQFVLEPLAGYLALAQALSVAPHLCPAALNLGPDVAAKATVADVATSVHRLWGRGEWVSTPATGPEEASDIRLDSSLARDSLGWRPRLSLEAALSWTVEWWCCADHHGDLQRLADSQIEAYEALSS